jgi:Insertion element 4 transposase N-terminal
MRGMAGDGVVRPDQVSLGVLVTAVPRDVVDSAVEAFGVGAKRSDGKIPAHVVAYLTMGLCLFSGDDYEEVAQKVTGSLDGWGCWDASWRSPSASAITQARKRLGPDVMREIFESVAISIAGDAGPLARSLVDAYTIGEKTLAARLYPRLQPDELLTADRGFYSFDAWGQASGTGADLLWRAPTQLQLSVVEVLTDGTYLSVLIDPKLRALRREKIIRDARDGNDLDPETARLVRVIEYDVPERAGNSHGELIVLLSTILDPEAARPDELAGAYHERWEQETANDQLKTHLRGPGRVLRSRLADLARQEIWALAGRPLRDQRPDRPRRPSRRQGPRPDLLHPRSAHHPPRPFPPEHWSKGLDHVLAAIARKLNPPRRDRTCPRALKRLRPNSYRAKRPSERSSIRHDGPATIKHHILTRAA